MLLTKEDLKKYSGEIGRLYLDELNERISGFGGICFGVIEDEILKAVGSVKNYYGSWYLRSDVVKPQFRGQGLQRLLIRERLEYLSNKTDLVRVSVFPDNFFSLRNIEAENFEFEKKKKLNNGKIVLVYKRRLS